MLTNLCSSESFILIWLSISPIIISRLMSDQQSQVDKQFGELIIAIKNR